MSLIDTSGGFNDIFGDFLKDVLDLGRKVGDAYIQDHYGLEDAEGGYDPDMPYTVNPSSTGGSGDVNKVGQPVEKTWMDDPWKVGGLVVGGVLLVLLLAKAL